MFHLFVVVVQSLSYPTLLRLHGPSRVAHQAPLSMGFSWQEYWSGLPSPSPGDFPNPGIEPMSPVGQAYSLPLSHQGSPRGQTFISCLSYMASQIFDHCVTWDALLSVQLIHQQELDFLCMYVLSLPPKLAEEALLSVMIVFSLFIQVKMTFDKIFGQFSWQIK